MVARINTSKSISKALNDNEQKVSKGVAEYIVASGFIKDKNELNFYDKLHHFKRCVSLNDKRRLMPFIYRWIIKKGGDIISQG